VVVWRDDNHEGASTPKHASKFSVLQVSSHPDDVCPDPHPMLDSIVGSCDAFLDLCLDLGQQVFSAPIEQGPR